MNIVDSSFWLEYFAGTPAGKHVSGLIKNTGELLIPTIVLYEVFKKLLVEKSENEASLAVAHMKQGKVIELDSESALSAAKISKEYKLPLADSIIYAAAKKYAAVVWTQDHHFENLESVKYFKKA